MEGGEVKDQRDREEGAGGESEEGVRESRN